MSLTRYIIKRILIAIPVLIGITVLDYLIMTLAGSPLAMLQGPRVSEAAVQAKAIQLGLDQPFIVQYWVWIKQLLHGNWGYSFRSYEYVATLIQQHLYPTVLLMGSSLLISLLIAVPAGIYSAVHQYSRSDYIIVTASFIGSSIPSFFLALALVALFSVKLGWLPSGNMYTLGAERSSGDVFLHLLLPMIVLVVANTGSIIRYIRASMLEILSQDYLKAARARGLGRRRVLYKHAFRNALVPVITVVGMMIPTLFGGAVIVEQVFSWPGLGLLTMQAISNRDFPIIMAVCLISALVVLVTNLLTDILYAVADPTIRYD